MNISQMNQNISKHCHVSYIQLGEFFSIPFLTFSINAFFPASTPSPDTMLHIRFVVMLFVIQAANIVEGGGARA